MEGWSGVRRRLACRASTQWPQALDSACSLCPCWSPACCPVWHAHPRTAPLPSPCSAGLVEYICSGPVVAIALEGKDVVAQVGSWG